MSVARTKNAMRSESLGVVALSAATVPLLRRELNAVSSAVMATAMGCGRAPAAAKVSRVGWLTAQREQSLTPFLEAFRGGLAEFGYRENDNLEIDYRFGDDNLLRVAPLAIELARMPVDVLVVQGAAVPLAGC